jgi:DNA-binding beta-propeller fold protein YncE
MADARPGAVVAAGSEHDISKHKFLVVVRDGAGEVLGQRSVEAGAARWTTEVGYQTPAPQMGTLEAVAFSAKDGAVTCLVQVAVSLQPVPRPPRIGDVYVTNPDGNSVSEFDVEPGGVLAPKSSASVATPDSPGGIAISPDGTRVYVGSRAGVTLYDAGADGVLARKSTTSIPVDIGTDPPTDPTFSPDGKSVYVTADESSVWEYDVAPDGGLTPKAPVSVPAGNGAQAVAVSPDGKSVYVVNSLDHTISQYDVGVGGVLTPKTPATVATDDAPVHVAIAPDGRSVYVSGINGISQYDVRSGGSLAPKPPALVPAPFCAAIVFIPGSQTAYGTDFGANGLYDFAVGSDGALAPPSPTITPAGSAPWDLVVSPDGRNVYATNTGSTTVSEYAVGAGGALTPLATISTPTRPLAIAIRAVHSP